MDLKLKIVGLLERNNGKDLTINEIATGLDEYYSFVHRIAGALIKEGIILTKKAGHSYLCLLNLKNEKTKVLVQLSEIERTLELYAHKKELRLILEDLTDLLKAEEVLSVILFGSYAKGNPSKESDIDILVICTGKPKVDKAAREIYARYGKEVNIVIMDIASFKRQKEKPIIKEIISNHYVLSGVEKFVSLVTDNGS